MNSAAIIVLVVFVLVGVLVAILVKQNKAGTYNQKSKKESSAMVRGIAIGYAIGIGPGIAIGVALDNIALGIAIGGSIGISIGIALGASFKKQEEAKSKGIHQQSIKSNESRLFIILGLLALLVGFLVLGWLLYSKMK